VRELKVYENVLPSLSVPTLGAFGVHPATDRTLLWLYLEDAGDCSYDGRNPGHRTGLAAWSADLHAATASARFGAIVPRLNEGDCSALIAEAKEVLRIGSDNPELKPEGLRILFDLDSMCEEVRTRWPWLMRVLAACPECVSHNSLSAKNVRVRETTTGLQILPIDWENATFGCPALGLAFLDLDLYRGHAQSPWSELPLDQMKTLKAIGQVLWCLKSISGEARSMRNKYTRPVIEKLSYYARLMHAAKAQLSFP
jgi:hypothetical protein